MKFSQIIGVPFSAAYKTFFENSRNNPNSLSENVGLIPLIANKTKSAVTGIFGRISVNRTKTKKDQLQRELDLTKQTTRFLESNYRTSENSLRTKERELTSLTHRYNTLTQRLNTVDSQSNSNLTILNDTRTQLNHLIRQINTKDRSIGNLEGQINALQERINILQRNETNLSQERKEIYQRMDAYSENYNFQLKGFFETVGQTHNMLWQVLSEKNKLEQKLNLLNSNDVDLEVASTIENRISKENQDMEGKFLQIQNKVMEGKDSIQSWLMESRIENLEKEGLKDQINHLKTIDNVVSNEFGKIMTDFSKLKQSMRSQHYAKVQELRLPLNTQKESYQNSLNNVQDWAISSKNKKEKNNNKNIGRILNETQKNQGSLFAEFEKETDQKIRKENSVFSSNYNLLLERQDKSINDLSQSTTEFFEQFKRIVENNYTGLAFNSQTFSAPRISTAPLIPSYKPSKEETPIGLPGTHYTRFESNLRHNANIRRQERVEGIKPPSETQMLPTLVPATVDNPSLTIQAEGLMDQALSPSPQARPQALPPAMIPVEDAGRRRQSLPHDDVSVSLFAEAENQRNQKKFRNSLQEMERIAQDVQRIAREQEHGIAREHGAGLNEAGPNEAQHNGPEINEAAGAAPQNRPEVNLSVLEPIRMPQRNNVQYERVIAIPSTPDQVNLYNNFQNAHGLDLYHFHPMTAILSAALTAFRIVRSFSRPPGGPGGFGGPPDPPGGFGGPHPPG